MSGSGQAQGQGSLLKQWTGLSAKPIKSLLGRSTTAAPSASVQPPKINRIKSILASIPERTKRDIMEEELNRIYNAASKRGANPADVDDAFTVVLDKIKDGHYVRTVSLNSSIESSLNRITNASNARSSEILNIIRYAYTGQILNDFSSALIDAKQSRLIAERKAFVSANPTYHKNKEAKEVQQVIDDALFEIGMEQIRVPGVPSSAKIQAPSFTNMEAKLAELKKRRRSTRRNRRTHTHKNRRNRRSTRRN